METVDAVILALEVPFFHQFSTLHGFTRYSDPLNTNVYIVVDFNNIMMI